MPDVPASHARGVAVVTGAARGIGEAIALRLAEDGLDVAVFDLPQNCERLEIVVAAIREKGRRALAVHGDVSLEADVVSLVERTVRVLGGIDAMVANAGIFSMDPIVDLSVEQFEHIMAVNTRGVMLALKYAGREMINQGRGGRIIAAASWGAKQGLPNMAAYCASKFAVRGLVQSAALEFRQHDITVNGYAPGLIITQMTTLPEDEVNGGPASTALKAAGLPVNTKPGTPAEVAALVSYLASPAARFTTGQCININGGLGMD
ncbi:NAD-P-binding protein [Trametes elegans]|nr:NAD-P-binding protein [Trametes elegans]